MSLAGHISQSAAQVPCGAGFRFRLVSEPAAGRVRGTVLLAHAFAEELNKTRRMAARGARLLAADGWRVVQRDMHGCGDSSGDFADATWDAWVDDVRDELRAADPALPIWLWCIRGGALLARPALERHPNVGLLLWQPVLSGAQHLQSFLRLHTGARILGRDPHRDELTPLERLRAQQEIEVGGYRVDARLAAEMQKAVFALPEGHAGRVLWMELSDAPAPQLSPASTLAIERLRSRDVDVTSQVLGGPPFWQTQEISECEAVLDCTRKWLGEETGWDAVVRGFRRGSGSAG